MMFIRDEDFSLQLFYTCGLITYFLFPNVQYSPSNYFTALIPTKIFKGLQIVLDPSVFIPSCFSNGISISIHFMIKNCNFQTIRTNDQRSSSQNISNKDKRWTFPEGERKETRLKQHGSPCQKNLLALIPSHSPKNGIKGTPNPAMA